MTTDYEQARELIKRCLRLRDSGENEAVLRSEIMSYLRLIFLQPEDDSWVSHYSRGTEAQTIVGQAGGGTANRFIDNLVGSTTIEYEADLRIPAKMNEGYGQVREHTAGLIRSGVPMSQVRGILSDTIDWYAYDVSLPSSVQPGTCTADDVNLQLIDSLSIQRDDALTAERFVTFIRKHLAREQSRPLRADLLTYDLGLESTSYQRWVGPLVDLVEAGRAVDSSILVATDLWSQFVDYLEGESGGFRTAAYVDEVYLCVLARLLTANVLRGQAMLSDDQQLKGILDGSYFRDQYQLENMVEQDYFGWLNSPQHADNLLPTAHEIQRDLYAYDFGSRPEEDLFGRLMAQLARRSQRQLLGQEWTPSWLARLLAGRCLENLPEGETPRIVDMCCGSGAILAEIVKTARSRFGLRDMPALQEVATGFDIDPLAVSLSKATWVASLATEINAARRPIVIPIYHADSLFAVSPVSKAIPPFGEGAAIEISLDGQIIELPSALVQPEYAGVFERIVDWAYDEAIDAKQKGNAGQLTKGVAEEFLKGVVAATGLKMPAALEKATRKAAYALASRMASLAISDRNGIWAFILRNAYRPGLLTGQFNGLVSNPPWLAMSRLADNPYRLMLRERAQIYGIQPEGQSFLHLELGTTHLLHAVDRYLAPHASIACLVPGTVFNGHHHEPFRQRKFLDSQRPIHLQIEEVWQVAAGTFKYPGAAIIARRGAGAVETGPDIVAGYVASHTGLDKVDFSERSIGDTRTAWVLERDGAPAVTHHPGELPQQGADLMPRKAVCIEILDESGPEFRVDTPSQGTPWGFTVKAAKELKADRFPGHVAPEFIHRMAQSENLIPFLLGQHRAPVALPAMRDDLGEWTVLKTTEIRRRGFIRTARRFRSIDERLKGAGKGTPLQSRVDERRKLTKQTFGSDGYLVVAGAGGKYICAACVPLEEASNLVVDQTLYWQVFGDADEAWYRVGMLNSHAMTEATIPFNPKGAFGERHIHSLPYRLMPPFDPEIDEHARIPDLAQRTAETVRCIVAEDPYLRDPSRALHVRRGKVREHLVSTPEYQELEGLCSVILGTTALEAAESHDMH